MNGVASRGVIRKIECGAGYLVQLNPIGNSYVNRQGAEVQKFGLNLWLRDEGCVIWHIACLGDFIAPPSWSDKQILKMAIKWLLMPVDVWVGKGRYYLSTHEEWLLDKEMVDEFKISVAYTLMDKPTKVHCEYRFRRAAKIERIKEVESNNGKVRRTTIIPTTGNGDELSVNEDGSSLVRGLQDEASNHGKLLQALSGLRNRGDG